jgi:hypothetical protein
MAKSRKRTPVSRGKPTTAVDSDGKKMSKEDQFRLEYAYVLRDLRTIFILAGAMFVLLIALNLIIR